MTNTQFPQRTPDARAEAEVSESGSGPGRPDLSRLAGRLQNLAYRHGMIDASDRWSDKKYSDADTASRAARSAITAEGERLDAELRAVKADNEALRAEFGLERIRHWNELSAAKTTIAAMYGGLTQARFCLQEYGHRLPTQDVDTTLAVIERGIAAHGSPIPVSTPTMQPNSETDVSPARSELK